LGKELGIPTPLNARLLALVQEMAQKKEPPGKYRPAELCRLLRAEAGD
ncbi:MAG: ketopantoate reductase family protein, partial [Nitrospinota bacterium]